MLEPSVRGFNPRAFLNSERAARPGRNTLRPLVVAAAAILVFSAFGSIVVKANDDNGVYGFISQQVRAPRAQQPVVSSMPQQFYPRSDGRQARGRETRQAREARTAVPRQPAILTSYAPFGNLFLPDTNVDRGRLVLAPAGEPVARERKARRVSREAKVSPSAVTGGRAAFCVRTCDGYYFPAPVGGSERQIEAACNRVCPTAEVKVYFGQVGGEMDEARAAAGGGGKRYASLANAFGYRRSIDAGCACNTQGFGMTTTLPLERDATLRAGDIVMTAQGLKVFNGGAMPYHNGNFTRVQRSARYEGRLREQLIAMDRASTRGLNLADVPARPARQAERGRSAPAGTGLTEKLSAMTPRQPAPRDGVARVVLASPLTEIR